MKKYSIVIIIITLSLSLQAQDVQKWTISPALIGGVFPHLPYNLKDYNPLLIPYLPFNKGLFYGEIRYNYDRNGTFGVYGGISKVTGNRTIQIFTPQLGILLGDYQALSIQFYYNLVHPRIEFNLTNNYAKVFNNRPDYYFNWSDIQFPIRKIWRAGASTQIFIDKNLQTYDFGPMIGYRDKGWYIMVTAFNPWSSKTNYWFFAIQKTLQL